MRALALNVTEVVGSMEANVCGTKYYIYIYILRHRRKGVAVGEKLALAANIINLAPA